MAIYFIQADGFGNAIKIGYASNPAHRIAQLVTATPAPITTLAICDGARRDEKRLHKLHRADHQWNEWFKPTDEVMATVEAARAGRIAERLALAPQPTASDAAQPRPLFTGSLAALDEFSSLKEAAAAVGVSPSAVSQWIADGAIPARRAVQFWGLLSARPDFDAKAYMAAVTAEAATNRGAA